MITIGRVDKIDLPLLELTNLDVKIDTGADSCSIHCHNIERVSNNTKVKFNLLDPKHPEYNEREFILDISRISVVKSSNGTSENRIFIKSLLIIFGKKYTTEISLTDRTSMKYPMLIGRNLLKGRFLVDVRLKNLSYTSKNSE